jgi:hypothetical protein
MEQYAGIDMSLGNASTCVVAAGGRIVREAKVASEPVALIAWFGGLEVTLTRIGWRRALYRNGCMRACGRRGSRFICRRPGTFVMPSRQRW